jgi:hypothetical protein
VCLRGSVKPSLIVVVSAAAAAAAAVACSFASLPSGALVPAISQSELHCLVLFKK